MMPAPVLRMIAATLIAPLAAPLSILVVIGLRHGGSAFAAPSESLPIVAVAVVFGYALAFIPVLLLGTALSLLSLRFSGFRPRHIWVATGLVFGGLIPLAAISFAREMPLYGALAGSACALVYRLIVDGALMDAGKQQSARFRVPLA